MLVFGLLCSAWVPATGLVDQLRASHHKLVDHRAGNNPELVPTDMHPIDPVSRDEGIKLEDILAIGANRPDVGALSIEDQIIT